MATPITAARVTGLANAWSQTRTPIGARPGTFTTAGPARPSAKKSCSTAAAPGKRVDSEAVPTRRDPPEVCSVTVESGEASSDAGSEWPIVKEFESDWIQTETSADSGGGNRRWTRRLASNDHTKTGGNNGGSSHGAGSVVAARFAAARQGSVASRDGGHAGSSGVPVGGRLIPPPVLARKAVTADSSTGSERAVDSRARPKDAAPVRRVLLNDGHNSRLLKEAIRGLGTERGSNLDSKGADASRPSPPAPIGVRREPLRTRSTAQLEKGYPVIDLTLDDDDQPGAATDLGGASGGQHLDAVAVNDATRRAAQLHLSPVRNRARSVGARIGGPIGTREVGERPGLHEAMVEPEPEAKLEDVPLRSGGIIGPIAKQAGAGSGWQSILCDEHCRSFVSFKPKIASEETLREWFDALSTKLEWSRPHSTGRALPRKACWLTSPGCSCVYRYSSMAWQPITMEPWFLEITDAVCQACNITERPNSCNANLYENGKETVGWHSDDEPCFGAIENDALIISLSLGASRTFLMKRRRGHGQQQTKEVVLADGDICTMEGLMQKHYLHAVLEEAAEDVRINLTWRWIVKHDADCDETLRAPVYYS